MLITVFVDSETFHNLVLERKSFDAMLFADAMLSKEAHSLIGVTVSLDKVYTTSDPDMVTVNAR